MSYSFLIVCPLLPISVLLIVMVAIAVLAEAAIRRDLAPEARIGPAGIALLPQRAPPEGQRYRVTLTKAREELDRYLPAPASRRPTGSGWPSRPS